MTKFAFMIDIYVVRYIIRFKTLFNYTIIILCDVIKCIDNYSNYSANM